MYGLETVPNPAISVLGDKLTTGRTTNEESELRGIKVPSLKISNT